MATTQDEGSVPAIRFKRRKVAHPKRVYAEEDVPVASECQAPDADARSDNAPPPPIRDEEDAVPNLRDIIRNRKRPRDRLKDVARQAEAPRTELAPVEATREGLYTSRFIAQTGQFVDKDDKQM